MFVNTLTPGTIGVFELTDEERALYEDNNLTLVPPGCCAPASYSMGRSIKEDCRIIYSGEVKSRKHLSALLEGYLDD